ncbi:MAG: hypothetical protein Q8P01_03870 [bacterium]|nr:hypothetical protein [bacterium]
MQRFLSLVSAVLDAFLTKSADAAKRLAPHGKAYLRLLVRLVVLASIPPFLLVPLMFFGGTARDVGVLTIAVLWSALTLLLTLAAAPVGLVLDALRGGVAGVGERYVRFVGNILFAEYSLAFLLLVIPLRNNLAGIPLLFVTFTILVLGGILSKRLMARFALLVLPVLLLSFFSPRIYSTLNLWFKAGEERVAGGVVGGEKPTDDGPPGVGSDTAHQEQELLPRVQEFTLEKKGDQLRTVPAGDGDYYIVQYNKPFDALNRSGSRMHYSATPSQRRLDGFFESDYAGVGAPGKVRVKALENNTTIRFIRWR